MESTAGEETVSLSFSPRPENVALARMLAGALAGRWGMPRESVDDVRLVVSEACTNAVRAQHRSGSDAEISLTCRLDGDFAVEISDHGCGDSILAHAGFPRPGSAESGYGIPLMRTIASEATFVRNDSGGTTVRLVVERAGESKDDAA